MVESGADRITFHFEATEEVEDTLNYIRKCNVKAGLAFCPETSTSMMVPYLDKCDLILLMTVNPGFGGQAFIEPVIEKIEFARQAIEKRNIFERQTDLESQNKTLFPIQVDGGITRETAKKCFEAGANDFVAGTYLFESDNLAKAIEGLRNLV